MLLESTLLVKLLERPRHLGIRLVDSEIGSIRKLLPKLRLLLNIHIIQ